MADAVEAVAKVMLEDTGGYLRPPQSLDDFVEVAKAAIDAHKQWLEDNAATPVEFKKEITDSIYANVFDGIKGGEVTASIDGLVREVVDAVMYVAVCWERSPFLGASQEEGK